MRPIPSPFLGSILAIFIIAPIAGNAAGLSKADIKKYNSAWYGVMDCDATINSEAFGSRVSFQIDEGGISLISGIGSIQSGEIELEEIASSRFEKITLSGSYLYEYMRPFNFEGKFGFNKIVLTGTRGTRDCKITVHRLRKPDDVKLIDRLKGAVLVGKSTANLDEIHPLNTTGSWIVFNRNGDIETSTIERMNAGKESLSGEWWIRDGKLCQQFDDGLYCNKYKISGDYFRLFDRHRYMGKLKFGEFDKFNTKIAADNSKLALTEFDRLGESNVAQSSEKINPPPETDSLEAQLAELKTRLAEMTRQGKRKTEALAALQSRTKAKPKSIIPTNINFGNYHALVKRQPLRMPIQWRKFSAISTISR